MSALRCYIKPYIQPFERTLAFAELTALTKQVRPGAGHSANCVEVDGTVTAEELARALAYWESIDNGRSNYTLQALREATVTVARNGVSLERLATTLPFRAEVPLAGRRCLRYGTHGLHEYRGKFFPQLVKALINIGRVPANGVVADPMCGSGTTLVESVLAGRRAVGLDLNPLSVRIARAKCLLLNADPARLERAYAAIRGRLERAASDRTGPLAYLGRMPAADQEYLRRWFSAEVLQQLDAIAGAVRRVRDEAAREFFLVVLSNILRRVSWQKTDDLRVRREMTDAEGDPIAAFLADAEKSLRMVLAFLYQNGRTRGSGRFTVDQGDARDLGRTWSRWRGRIDAVITSPPYATALPYLDTDRLSLCYLGLLTRPEHRRQDLVMIGNREITEGTRRHYWELFQQRRPHLPDGVARLVARIDSLNSEADVGFRRRNVAALLAKYFLDMRAVLSQIGSLAKPDAPVYIVVGSNHTIAGGQRVEIKTAGLLAETAQSLGFSCDSALSMEMLRSRDIFKHNASDNETLLMLRAPQSGSA